MNYILGALIVFVIGYTYSTRPSMKDHWQMGYQAGLKEALKTNPPSQDLEMACAGLWVGEQNRKYFEKEHRSAR
jgi:hypothetical protein